MNFKPKPPEVEVEQPGQLNVDVGKVRRDRLRKFCKAHRVKIAPCMRQMIDHCIGGRNGRG